MSPAQALLQNLPLPQQAAINLIKLSLDCFNSYDGTGLFTGTSRYQMLQARVEIASVQARSLFDFWSILLRRMQWPLPPKKADDLIVSALSGHDDHQVLASLSKDTASIISIARMLHDQDKATAKALRDELSAEPPADLNMPLPEGF